MNASFFTRLLLPTLLISSPLFAQDDSPAVYFTNGVHNTLGCNAKNGNCIAPVRPPIPAIRSSRPIGSATGPCTG